jgi:hypothetical protein
MLIADIIKQLFLTVYARFGSGYTLVVRCPVDKTEAMQAHMTQQLPEAVLSESHHTRLRFQLPSSSCKLSVALGALEAARERDLLYDYSVSQTTLEEVIHSRRCFE